MRDRNLYAALLYFPLAGTWRDMRTARRKTPFKTPIKTPILDRKIRMAARPE